MQNHIQRETMESSNVARNRPAQYGESVSQIPTASNSSESLPALQRMPTLFSPVNRPKMGSRATSAERGLNNPILATIATRHSKLRFQDLSLSQITTAQNSTDSLAALTRVEANTYHDSVEQTPYLSRSSSSDFLEMAQVPHPKALEQALVSEQRLRKRESFKWLVLIPWLSVAVRFVICLSSRQADTSFDAKEGHPPSFNWVFLWLEVLQAMLITAYSRSEAARSGGQISLAWAVGSGVIWSWTATALLHVR